MPKLSLKSLKKESSFTTLSTVRLKAVVCTYNVKKRYLNYHLLESLYRRGNVFYILD